MNHWWKIKIVTDNKEIISGFLLTDTDLDPTDNNEHIDIYHFYIRERKAITCRLSMYTIYANKITYIQTYYLGTEPTQVGYDCV